MQRHIKTGIMMVGLILAGASAVLGVPSGLCLHAYSPEAPAEKIECFEFTKAEQMANGYRFFLEPTGSTIVTNYRYRSVIPYVPNLQPGNPEFEKTLRLYETTARSSPLTRRFLNPKIMSMRQLVAAQVASEQALMNLPKVEVDGLVYISPSYQGIDNGRLTLKHSDGVAKIRLDSLSDAMLQAIVKIDPKAAEIKVVKIAGSRLWNPKFGGIHSEKVIIDHENGSLALPFSSLSEEDIRLITKWSDGSWKIKKPGFYGFKIGGASYDEIVLDSGKFYPNAELAGREGMMIVIDTDRGTINTPVKELLDLPGISDADRKRIDGWVEGMIEELFAKASPKSSIEVLSFEEAEVLRVSNVRVKILQVFDEGVLASGFVGRLDKGKERIRTTVSIEVKHPLTGADLTRVVDTSESDRRVVEDVSDDLCYIVGNTSNLTEGEIVKADSMKLMGRYQYQDVLQRPRTVRKYHVD
jgi:hypothetical protein